MRALAFLMLLASASAALAHDGSDHGAPGWTWDPWITAPLLISAIMYTAGIAQLWARSQLGRSALRRDAALFAAGWTLLALAVLSPLHEGGERSFTLHMIEHELIMLPAALLLVSARPGAAFLWSLPKGLRTTTGAIAAAAPVRGSWQALSHPITATILQAAALVLWHVPALFDRALAEEPWHVAQHLSFLFTALLFWWSLSNGRAGRRSPALAAACLFITSMIGGLLGALMSFSTSPWYEGYAAMNMSPIGLDPVEDQQLAGLIMWVPGGVFHAGAALWFVYKWLCLSEKNDAVAAE